MNEELINISREINTLIKETPLYKSYVHLKQTVENDTKLMEEYTNLLTLGGRIQTQESPASGQSGEIPTALKQYISVQKELSHYLQEVIEEIHSH